MLLPELLLLFEMGSRCLLYNCGDAWQQTVIIAFSSSQSVSFPVESYAGNCDKIYVGIVCECFSNRLFDTVSAGCHILGTGIEA